MGWIPMRSIAIAASAPLRSTVPVPLSFSAPAATSTPLSATRWRSAEMLVSALTVVVLPKRPVELPGVGQGEALHRERDRPFERRLGQRGPVRPVREPQLERSGDDHRRGADVDAEERAHGGERRRRELDRGARRGAWAELGPERRGDEVLAAEAEEIEAAPMDQAMSVRAISLPATSTRACFRTPISGRGAPGGAAPLDRGGRAPLEGAVGQHEHLRSAVAIPETQADAARGERQRRRARAVLRDPRRQDPPGRRSPRG